MTIHTDQDADVIVVGAGNAGLVAALAALERGRSVLVLERAPREHVGGNSYFTAGATRIAHGGLGDLLDLVEPDVRHALTFVPPYSVEDYVEDLHRVTEGRTDPSMAWLEQNVGARCSAILGFTGVQPGSCGGLGHGKVPSRV